MPDSGEKGGREGGRKEGKKEGREKGETYIILLTNVTPINLILNKRKRKGEILDGFCPSREISIAIWEVVTCSLCCQRNPGLPESDLP